MISIKSYAVPRNNTGSSSGGIGGTTIVKNTLESHTLWGQSFNGTNDVKGDMTNVGNIDAQGDLNLHTYRDNYNNIVGGNVNADGNINAKSNLTVDGNGLIKGNFRVNGTATLPTINSNNITNSDTITTKNLKVTGQAHFFELIIDKIKAAGGAALFTPADGFTIDYVEGPISYDSGSKHYYNLLWRATDGNGNARKNMWKAGDQALCMSFNQAKTGTSFNVSNKYYWALVIAVNTQPITFYDGLDYNYIRISCEDYDGELKPEIGDDIAMLGYRGTDDASRQSAIYISAYSSLDSGLTAPLLAQYKGINNFNLSTHRQTYWDANGAKFIGNFEANNGQSLEDYVESIVNASLIIDDDGIAAKVTGYIDGKLRDTGIDITNGTIELTADNTLINGNLNIHNASEGITMYDNVGNPKIMIQNDNVGSLSDFSFDASGSVKRNIYITPSTDKNYTLNIIAELGSGAIGDTYTIKNFIIKIPDDYAITDVTFKYSFRNNNNIIQHTVNNVTTKEEYTPAITLSKVTDTETFNGTTRVYVYYKATVFTSKTFTTNEAGPVTLVGELKFKRDNCRSYSYTLDYEKRNTSSGLTHIGYDGMVVSSGENKYAWLGADEYQLRYKLSDTYKNKYNKEFDAIKVDGAGVQRYLGSSRTSEFWGEIGSSMNVTTINSANYNAFYSDAFILMSTVFGSTSDKTVCLPKPTGVPGKYYIVRNIDSYNGNCYVYGSNILSEEHIIEDNNTNASNRVNIGRHTYQFISDGFYWYALKLY